jgi:hypothetical protein
VTVGEAGFDISVFYPTYLSSDNVALEIVAVETFNGMSDPIPTKMARNIMIDRAEYRI